MPEETPLGIPAVDDGSDPNELLDKPPERAKKKAPAGFGILMAFVRVTWPDQVTRGGSILKALMRRWPEREVEAMIHGAALLGWQDLRAVNSKDGLGRRLAMAKYWDSQKAAPAHELESLGAIFKAKGLV